jgi:FkbM family methyltransferase
MKNGLERVLSDIQSYDLDNYTVVVFGAGNTSVLYQKCFESEGIRPVYYIDNSEAKQGTVFQGVPVISVEELVSSRQTFDKPILVLICSAQIAVCGRMQLQLQEYGLAYTTVDAVVFKKNTDKIKTVCDLLADDFSRDVYTQVILSRINNRSIPKSLVSDHEQYFSLPPFLEFSEKEVFVDLGAYVGDTVEQYINKKLGMFGKIYAFEPDALNFSALSHRSVRLKNEWALPDGKLTIIRGGIGAKTEQKLFAAPHGAESQTSSSTRLGANFVADTAENAEEVTVYAIDDYFKEQHIDFIKADIEGYELNMLKGAKSVIKRDMPLLSVCLYHNASDMYSIPLFIKELCDDYTLEIRHHTYGLFDTVLYAYV